MRFGAAFKRLVAQGSDDFSADAYRRVRREIDAERRERAKKAPAAVADRRLRAQVKAGLKTLHAQRKAELTAELAKQAALVKREQARACRKSAYLKERARLISAANAVYRRHIAAGVDIDEAIRLVAISNPIPPGPR